MNRLKKYIDIIGINVGSILVGLTLYQISLITDEIFIGIVAAGISISFGVRQYNIEQDRMFMDLFTRFNQRYDELNNNLNIISQGGKLPKKVTGRNVMEDYLNLCAEEYLWYKKGRIEKIIWASWEQGILENVKSSKKLKKYFEDESKNPDSFYGFFKWYNERKQNPS